MRTVLTKHPACGVSFIELLGFVIMFQSNEVPIPSAKVLFRGMLEHGHHAVDPLPPLITSYTIRQGPIRTVQIISGKLGERKELLGHKNLETTRIYLHVKKT